jgi:hypothetical protein
VFGGVLVLLRCAGVHQDVVNGGEAEVEPPQNIVHESLEILRGVAQQNDMNGNSNSPNGVEMAVFCTSSGCTGI